MGRLTPSARQTLAFDQAREQIAAHVLDDKRKREFFKYLDKLRAQAILDWKNEEIRKAYLEGLKRQAVEADAPSQ